MGILAQEPWVRLVLGTGILGSAIPTIPPRCRYFQMSDTRYQRYPGISNFEYLTIPARSGIFNSHTYDTNNTPAFRDFDILPYRLHQVFSDAIPTIPTIPRYSEISIFYHTGSIRYFQQPCLRYQRYPGILRFRYLPYRLNQVFSEVITAIPTIPRYFGTYHTSSIRYSQMRYP